MSTPAVRPPLVVLAGPTASGKSALALQWAQELDAEIVGADSQQVYRYFDIGTAKPTLAELALVPHHLISVAEPDEPFSAGRYRTLADQAIEEITSRGKRVLVVGGTGLYLRVLLHGVIDAPPVDPALRAQLEVELRELGLSALHQRLTALDPESASRIAPADRVRILRALELQRQTGQPASALRSSHGFGEDRYPYQLKVLSPPRPALYAAIDQRTRAMFEGGLLQEVEELLRRGYREAAPMRSVGYAQALQVVEGRMGLAQAIAEAAQKTRHYAKRQLTWFRKEKGAQFIDRP